MYRITIGVNVPNHGYFPNYSVDSNGVVTNNKTHRVLKQFPDRGGYLGVKLYNNGKKQYCRVHRLVAYNFIDKEEAKEEVNHINGNKKDNRLLNLEYTTKNENMRHAHDLGLYPRGKRCGFTKLSEETARQIIYLLFIENYSVKEVSEKLEINSERIRSIKNKKAWKWLIKQVLFENS